MTHDRPTLTCLSSRSGEFDKSLERVTIQRPRTTETRRINGNDSTRERTSDDREVSTGRTQAWPQQNRRPGRITPLANRQTADQPLVHDCSLSACCSAVRAPDRSVARRILPPKSRRPLPVPMHRGSAVPAIGAHERAAKGISHDPSPGAFGGSASWIPDRALLQAAAAGLGDPSHIGQSPAKPARRLRLQSFVLAALPRCGWRPACSPALLMPPRPRRDGVGLGHDPSGNGPGLLS